MQIDEIKIGIIIPYFGKWPSYFNIFLKGCSNNSWMDIIFFTDCEIPDEHPTNITFIPTTLKALNILINNKLGRSFSINNAYKLCDFRPTYGLVFEDYLIDYDFWGYGDIDLVYGDLKPFIIDRIIDGFDVLSNRSEILSGSLSLFRNNTTLKNLFNKSNEFNLLLDSSDYEALDEVANNNLTWHGGSKSDLPKYCFTYLVYNEDRNNNLKVSFLTTCKEEIAVNETIQFNNGNLFFKQKSLGYYHYVCNKNDERFIFPNWKDVPNYFFVTATGFYKTTEFYNFINYYRIVKGCIENISIRAWKRITK